MREVTHEGVGWPVHAICCITAVSTRLDHCTYRSNSVISPSRLRDVPKGVKGCGRKKIPVGVPPVTKLLGCVHAGVLGYSRCRRNPLKRSRELGWWVLWDEIPLPEVLKES